MPIRIIKLAQSFDYIFTGRCTAERQMVVDKAMVGPLDDNVEYSVFVIEVVETKVGVWNGRH